MKHIIRQRKIDLADDMRLQLDTLLCGRINKSLQKGARKPLRTQLWTQLFLPSQLCVQERLIFRLTERSLEHK